MTTVRRSPLPVVLVGAAVLLLLLLPRTVDLPIAWLAESHLLGDAANGGTLLWWLFQDLANVALFVPVGLVLAHAFRSTLAVCMGVGLSGACELAQHWIPNRDGSLLDLLMNSIGTLVGVAAMLLLRRRRQRKPAER